MIQHDNNAHSPSPVSWYRLPEVSLQVGRTLDGRTSSGATNSNSKTVQYKRIVSIQVE